MQVLPMETTKPVNIKTQETETGQEKIPWEISRALQIISWYIVPTIYIIFSVIYFSIYVK